MATLGSRVHFPTLHQAMWDRADIEQPKQFRLASATHTPATALASSPLHSAHGRRNLLHQTRNSRLGCETTQDSNHTNSSPASGENPPVERAVLLVNRHQPALVFPITVQTPPAQKEEWHGHSNDTLVAVSNNPDTYTGSDRRLVLNNRSPSPLMKYPLLTRFPWICRHILSFPASPRTIPLPGTPTILAFCDASPPLRPHFWLL
ncbi:hypothetical protein BD769DRAFT_1676709 [Suillus cothurnatus]|nr:hypothetical protein BD769DRAFT_1676709 [Suillus cothurnatus]